MKDDAEDGKAFSLTTAYSSLLAPAPPTLLLVLGPMEGFENSTKKWCPGSRHPLWLSVVDSPRSPSPAQQTAVFAY